jgi:hypothetical protein
LELVTALVPLNDPAGLASKENVIVLPLSATLLLEASCSCAVIVDVPNVDIEVSDALTAIFVAVTLGVTEELLADQEPSPIAFIARTWNIYDVPLVKPVTV